jgi:diketogulonate reductase-like aldo/keto reductase
MTPKVTANGAEIPAIGFGTWELRGDVAVRAVGQALDVGYRHIDTAAMYGNEAEVGEAIRNHATARDEIFVTTKVWHTDLSTAAFRRSAEASLKKLGMAEVDLLLIHWPSKAIPFAEQIHALCAARKQGLTRHVGVANFPPKFVEAAVSIADEPLVTNQVEYHPYLDQSGVIAACKEGGLSLTSYSPIGRGALLSDAVIAEIARTKGKTPAQIILRWHLQQPGTIAIPRSSNPARIEENFSVFDFALTPDEMTRISGLARPDGRMVNASFAPEWNGAP